MPKFCPVCSKSDLVTSGGHSELVCLSCGIRTNDVEVNQLYEELKRDQIPAAERLNMQNEIARLFRPSASPFNEC